MRPVFEDIERGAHDASGVGGHLEHVHRLVERCGRIEVGAKAHSHTLQKVHNTAFRKAPRAVECHVLDEMRDATLGIVFENGSGVHHQTQLRPPLGLRIAADEESQAVGQLAGVNGGIGGEGLGEVGRLRGGDRGRECECENEADAEHGGKAR